MSAETHGDFNKWGAKSTVADEDIHLRPDSSLKLQLMEETLDETLDLAFEIGGSSPPIDENGDITGIQFCQLAIILH